MAKIKIPLSKAIKIKALVKKQPQATYVIGATPEYSRSSFYNKEYEKERKLLGWK